MSDLPELATITLPSGTVYRLIDEQLRALVDTLTSATVYLGTTTTAISDGSTVNTVVIGEETVTAKAGNIVQYGNSEFIWSDIEGKWRELGSTGSLKALAFKDSATASYKPDGTVSQPSFTGKAATLAVKTKAVGTVAISKGTGTANYTPQGTVSAPAVSVAVNTASVKPFGSAGTLPSCTLPTLEFTVTGKTLKIDWSAGSFDKGTLPTAGEAVNVAVGIKSATASAPTFTGKGAELKAEFTGTEQTTNVSYTPEGEVSQPTFNGTSATITVK